MNFTYINFHEIKRSFPLNLSLIAITLLLFPLAFCLRMSKPVLYLSKKIDINVPMFSFCFSLFFYHYLQVCHLQLNRFCFLSYSCMRGKIHRVGKVSKSFMDIWINHGVKTEKRYLFYFSIFSNIFLTDFLLYHLLAKFQGANFYSFDFMIQSRSKKGSILLIGKLLISITSTFLVKSSTYFHQALLATTSFHGYTLVGATWGQVWRNLK